MYLLVEINYQYQGYVSLTFAISPRYSLEMSVLQKSYFLWEFQTENCVTKPYFGHTYEVSYHKCDF